MERPLPHRKRQDRISKLYSYSTMDLSLTKQLGRMMVFAGIDNLFDKTFDTDSSFAIPGRFGRWGRSGSFSLVWFGAKIASSQGVVKKP